MGLTRFQVMAAGGSTRIVVAALFANLEIVTAKVIAAEEHG